MPITIDYTNWDNLQGKGFVKQAKTTKAIDSDPQFNVSSKKRDDKQWQVGNAQMSHKKLW